MMLQWVQLNCTHRFLRDLILHPSILRNSFELLIDVWIWGRALICTHRLELVSKCLGPHNYTFIKEQNGYQFFSNSFLPTHLLGILCRGAGTGGAGGAIAPPTFASFNLKV